MSCRAVTWAQIFWWAVYATAFGCVEATVVVYLRRATGMAPGLDYPAIFKLRGAEFSAAGIHAELRRNHLLGLEIGREAATLILLFGAAWAAGRTFREKLALFGFTFAIWDLTYYLFLACYIHFPRSLFDTDIYYLIPIGWYGPVWFPVLVFMPTIIVLSLRVLVRIASVSSLSSSRQ